MENLTTREIYDSVERLDRNITQDEFSRKYCGRSSSYLRTMLAMKKDLPTSVLVNITNRLIENQSALLMKLASKDKHLVSDLIENIATMIARQHTLYEHKKLRRMLIRIVDRINEEKEPSAMPILFS